MKYAAGIVAYRKQDEVLQIFLVHPGGPFWKNKDTHAWSIPKGLMEEDEEPEGAARREFEEETGFILKDHLEPLATVKLSSSKTLRAFVIHHPEIDPQEIESNHFEMEWPPKSGKMQSFPEVDKAGWFTFEQAVTKMHKGQLPLVKLLEEWVQANH